MGYSVTNEQKKIRISLSDRAYSTINEDMEIFSETGLSKFINTVFKNFYTDSIATVSSRLEDCEYDIDRKISKLKLDKATKKELKEHLLELEEKEIKAKIKEYKKEKKNSRTYYLNNENIEILTNLDNDQYLPKAGSYLKVILEEYASLPFIKRERIYKKNTYDTIEYAIANKKVLKIKMTINGKQETLTVNPYKIVADPMNTQEYLACYSRLNNEPTSAKKPASFSLARIPKPSSTSQNSFLSKEDISVLNKKIATLGVAYLLGEETKIVVRLNDYGVNLYHSKLTNRPTKDDNLSTENKYVFFCSELQAFNYFFSFGGNAEVLEPLSLRERIIDTHRNALDSYKEKE